MLVNELGAVVDLIVDDEVNVLLGVVLGNILVGELLDGRHVDCLLVVSTGCSVEGLKRGYEKSRWPGDKLISGCQTILAFAVRSVVQRIKAIQGDVGCNEEKKKDGEEDPVRLRNVLPFSQGD